MHWEHNMSAIAGDAAPQIAIHKGQVWLMWSESKNSQGISLGMQGEYTHDQAKIVVAKLTSNLVEVESCYVVNPAEYVELQSLNVTEGGSLAFWTERRNGITELMVGQRKDKVSAMSIEGSVLSAKTVALPDGTVVLGVITLKDKKTTLALYKTCCTDEWVLEDLGLRINDIWSVSMAPEESNGVWIAWDAFVDQRFCAFGGYLDLGQGGFEKYQLPGTGYATSPAVTATGKGTAWISYREEKVWGQHVYGFNRSGQVWLVGMDKDGVLSTEVVPIPPVPEDPDEQYQAFGPVPVEFDGCLRLFYRWFRGQIRARTLVNDWGWQLYEMVRDAAGDWREPVEVSLDVGYNEPIQVVKTAERELYCIYHSCSFDSQRGTIHSRRINIARSQGYRRRPIVKQTLSCLGFTVEDRPRLKTRPTVAVDSTNLKCFWGDIHRHSLVSKCIPEHDGTYMDHLRYAMQVRGFDFYSVTDHDDQITEEEWRELLNLLDTAYDPGSFATLYGFEGPLSTVKGHINFYFLEREAAEFGIRRLRWMKSLPEIHEACRKLNLVDRIFSVRHFHGDGLPFADIIEGDGAFHPDFDWVMEAVQGRGYAPRAINTLLQQGFRFGMVGSTDHNRPPGHPNGGIGIYEQAITGLWAEDMTRQDVFSALKQRRCFSSNGPFLATWIRVNGTFMGGVAAGGRCNTIEVQVHPTTRITSVRLIRDGKVVDTRKKLTSEPTTYTFTDEPKDTMNHWYYAEVIQKPEPGLDYEGIAWTSPVWVTSTAKTK
ncbi:MAG: CehA/McbA family metallohydrolase [Limnochordia bacterium]|nr:CehA/McbA family metallohydrolase [Limnochordia bacterium]